MPLAASGAVVSASADELGSDDFTPDEYMD
jgi:hypothetical protein